MMLEIDNAIAGLLVPKCAVSIFCGCFHHFNYPVMNCLVLFCGTTC